MVGVCVGWCLWLVLGRQVWCVFVREVCVFGSFVWLVCVVSVLSVWCLCAVRVCVFVCIKSLKEKQPGPKDH